MVDRGDAVIWRRGGRYDKVWPNQLLLNAGPELGEMLPVPPPPPPPPPPLAHLQQSGDKEEL